MVPFFTQITAVTEGEHISFLSVHLLVIRNAAVNHSFLAGVHNYKWQVNHRIGCWWSICLLLRLTVSLNEILEGNLLLGMQQLKYRVALMTEIVMTGLALQRNPVHLSSPKAK